MSDGVPTTTATEYPAGRYPDAVIAYAILRISFGINFMLHGFSRLLTNHAKFSGYVNQYFEHTPC